MNRLKIAVIDIGMGNVFSVLQACLHAGLDAVLTKDQKVLKNAQGVILPGVGAFGRAMENLKKSEIDICIKELASEGKPLLGVCLGMQLFLTQSKEFGDHKGFNFIPGVVQKLPEKRTDGQLLRTPLISWRKITHQVDKNDESKLSLKQLMNNDYYYFVHSFYCNVENKSVIKATTTYGGFEYPSVINYKNILGVQFHPEKSGNIGINFYKNWAEDIKNSNWSH